MLILEDYDIAMVFTNCTGFLLALMWVFEDTVGYNSALMASGGNEFFMLGTYYLNTLATAIFVAGMFILAMADIWWYRKRMEENGRIL